MKKRILTATAAALAALACAPAFAKADCKPYPRAEWMKPEEAKAKIQVQGYKIRKFKVDGNCYEIYGHDKQGRKVEIYFDAKTLEPVKTEID